MVFKIQIGTLRREAAQAGGWAFERPSICTVERYTCRSQTCGGGGPVVAAHPSHFFSTRIQCRYSTTPGGGRAGGETVSLSLTVAVPCLHQTTSTPRCMCSGASFVTVRSRHCQQHLTHILADAGVLLGHELKGPAWIN